MGPSSAELGTSEPSVNHISLSVCLKCRLVELIHTKCTQNKHDSSSCCSLPFMDLNGSKRWKAFKGRWCHHQSEQFRVIFSTLCSVLLSCLRVKPLHVCLSALIQPTVIKVGSRPSSGIDLNTSGAEWQ